MSKFQNLFLDKCLLLWHSDFISNHIPISEEMFNQQAKIFGDKLGISKLQFKYSKGRQEIF